jgi:long-chain acyl-CoA synthetase
MTQAAPASVPWPAMSVQQAYALITQPGTAGEMEEVEIRGVKTRTWKNAPPTPARYAGPGPRPRREDLSGP